MKHLDIQKERCSVYLDDVEIGKKYKSNIGWVVTVIDKVTKNINLWTQFNNVFNKEYQRWNQYPVYGFNFVGGVVFSFDQKN